MRCPLLARDRWGNVRGEGGDDFHVFVRGAGITNWMYANGGASYTAYRWRTRSALLTSTLRSRSVEYKAELTRRFAEHALPLFASGEYTPVLDAKSFALDDAQAAHEYLEENSSIGKVTLLVESAEVCEAST